MAHFEELFLFPNEPVYRDDWWKVWKPKITYGSNPDYVMIIESEGFEPNAIFGEMPEKEFHPFKDNNRDEWDVYTFNHPVVLVKSNGDVVGDPDDNIIDWLLVNRRTKELRLGTGSYSVERFQFQPDLLGIAQDEKDPAGIEAVQAIKPERTAVSVGTKRKRELFYKMLKDDDVSFGMYAISGDAALTVRKAISYKQSGWPSIPPESTINQLLLFSGDYFRRGKLEPAAFLLKLAILYLVKYELLALNKNKVNTTKWFNKILEVLKPTSAESLNEILRPMFEAAFFELGDDAPIYEGL